MGGQSWKAGGALLPALICIGCAVDGAGEPVTPPPHPTTVVARAVTAQPQPSPAAAVPHAPDTGAAPIADRTVDARVLVITADGTDLALAAITAALTRLGTPFEVRDATHGPRLGADQLASGNHGKYQAVILDRGSLLTGTASALTADEWRVLATYEAAFGVRRAGLYTPPDAGYGFAAAVATSTDPVTAHCTTDGAAIFTGANCAGPISIQDAYVYAASPADAATLPLLRDDAGHALAATRRYPDGREALVLTFSQADGAPYTMQLLYGVIRWATRGLFLGERHVYLNAQIDDLFLPSRIYGGQPYRIIAADLQTFYDWQTMRRHRPTTAALRFDFALNAAPATDGDALTAKAKAIGTGFKWINHTWDHRDMAVMAYADALDEFEHNDKRVAELGLQPYTTTSAVTPDVSGLANAAVMMAARDAGIRYLVSDTSRPGYANPSFNEGITNALVSDILMIPRRPTNLFYSVSTPTEWTAEYNDRYRAQGRPDLTYAKILEHESDVLLGYLLSGENDPWMFHQANTRDDGGGHSLLTDLMDRLLAKYDALMTVPVVSPTMDELGARLAARMRCDAAGASATIGPEQTVTLHVSHGAARVPITGLCTPGAEAYAGDWISYVDVTPAADVTLTPGGCGSGGGDGGTSSPPTDAAKRPDDANAAGMLSSVPDGGVLADGPATGVSAGAAAAARSGSAGSGCGCTEAGKPLGAPLATGISLLLALLINRWRWR